MKLLLNILKPETYEFISPELHDSITYITHPDTTPGSEELWGVYENSGLWRDSRCMGIDFKEIFSKESLNILEYSQECSYTLSEEATMALLSDLPNYPGARVIQGSRVTGRNTVYEFLSKTSRDKAVLLINPEYAEVNLQVLPCISQELIEIDTPGQAAVDYYTSESLYIVTPERLSELLLGFPWLAERLAKYKDTQVILRWDGVIREHREPSPWRIKLENLRDEIDKVLDSNICKYLKGKNINRIIKKYYGNVQERSKN